MDLEADIVVIGGGMAGLVAGIRATEEGMKTVLLRKGQSATAYSSGAIDVIGYLPGGTVPLGSPVEGFHGIASMFPFHPYGLLGFTDAESNTVSKTIVEKVRAAVSWLKATLLGSNIPLFGDIDSNLDAITVLGTVKPTCMIQETMWPGSLMLDEEGVALFAGVRGLPLFNPRMAAQVFLEHQILNRLPPRKVGHHVLDLAPFGNNYNISSIEIARYLDNEDNLSVLAKTLKKQADRIGATHIALPPVLGFNRARENQLALQDLTGAHVFELLSFPPSVPGLRLQRGLETAFVKSGGTLLVGHHAKMESLKSNIVKKVTAVGPRRNFKISTKAVVLATGKFIGGGITGTENGIRESVFDLMTVSESFRIVTNATPQKLTNTVALSHMGHPLFGSGLSVDPQFRPITEEEVHAAENLYAAGSVLAGYNYPAEKSGLGVAMVTGYIASRNAVDYVKGVSA
ncbi:MAG: anaerobic glycerol-3-phosphate dehydrogenase subunit GlpB [Candidatus Thorarchaeota archaeon]